MLVELAGQGLALLLLLLLFFTQAAQQALLLLLCACSKSGGETGDSAAPKHAAAEVAVIGNGNVALDVARILAKTQEEFAGSDIVAHELDMLRDSKLEKITILGRRGPHQIAMTPKELGELGKLENACPRVAPADLPPEDEDAMLEPGQRKSVGHLRSFAAIAELGHLTRAAERLHVSQPAMSVMAP